MNRTGKMKKNKSSVTFSSQTGSKTISSASASRSIIGKSTYLIDDKFCNTNTINVLNTSENINNYKSNTKKNNINEKSKCCRSCCCTSKMNSLSTTSNSNSNTNTNNQQNNNNQIQSSSSHESDRLNIGHNNNQQFLTPSSSAAIGRNSSTSSITVVEELQISRRPSIILQELLSARRPSALMAALRPTPNHSQNQRPRLMSMLHEDPQNECSKSLNATTTGSGNLSTGPNCEMAIKFKRKNRRIGDDALSTALSLLYCKLMVILGVAMPVTEIISSRIPAEFYQGFYVYLYLGSIVFVIFVYLAHIKSRALFNIIKSYHEKTSNIHIKRKTERFGSFYLRVGAIAFGIGTMVYSGLEFGQYFELHGLPGCQNYFIALTPAARMALAIFQMQFIFLNTTELDMGRHKVFARFGLMHMVATNLCEWLYILVEETKHEIYHIMHPKNGHVIENFFIKSIPKLNGNELNKISSDFQNISLINQNVTYITNVTEELVSPSTTENMNSENYINCQRTNIMGSLVQDASPFLFPCTIEYSLICAVILYEMWKKVKSIPDIAKSRNDLQKYNQRMAHHFSVDCSRAHRGMFAGILIIVMTIICMIMYFVLHVEPGYELLAMQEVTICETVIYVLTSIAVIAAMIRMRDLRFLNKQNDKHSSSVSLDCTLLVLAQTGTYVYGMFSIMGSYFSIAEGTFGGKEALIAEVIGLIQTSIQTLFILNACWRRCKGAQQQRTKPGRELVTFLLIANVCMWFINTLIKGRAAFRHSHLDFFGIWAWTIITHVSMPLAIFYRFHSTICLFEIWKSTYKVKSDH